MHVRMYAHAQAHTHTLSTHAQAQGLQARRERCHTIYRIALIEETHAQPKEAGRAQPPISRAQACTIARPFGAGGATLFGL
jgi:hypothetical protein